jgi:hypothetical protein
MHAYWFSANESRHFFEPAVSGKGLGSSQTIQIHYAQTDLSANDMLLFCGRLPNPWVTPLDDVKPSSFDALRRRLTSLTSEDLNAVLFQVNEGTGKINLIKGLTMAAQPAPQPEAPQVEETIQDEEPAPQDPTSSLPAIQEPEPTPETGAHLLQPSAYAIPAQQPEPSPAADPLAGLPRSGKTVPRDFPSSIPRAKPQIAETVSEEKITEEVPEVTEQDPPPAVEQPRIVEQPLVPREPSVQTKQAAKAIVNIMQGFRTGSAALGERFRNFLPRLLPAENPEALSVSSTAFMGFMAVLIPLIVVTILVVVYLRYGRNEQYDAYYNEALEKKQQALALTDPVEQRIAWENVLANVDQAEEHRQTNETMSLRQEAEANPAKTTCTCLMPSMEKCCVPFHLATAVLNWTQPSTASLVLATQQVLWWIFLPCRSRIFMEPPFSALTQLATFCIASLEMFRKRVYCLRQIPTGGALPVSSWMAEICSYWMLPRAPFGCTSARKPPLWIAHISFLVNKPPHKM